MFLNAILKIPFLFVLFDSLAFRSENETVNYAFLTPRYFGNAIHCWGRQVVWARAACTHTHQPVAVASVALFIRLVLKGLNFALHC